MTPLVFTDALIQNLFPTILRFSNSKGGSDFKRKKYSDLTSEVCVRILGIL